MAWYQAFRNEYGFPFYGDNRTPVTRDKSLMIVAYVCVLVSIATLIATLGIRGREKWSYAIRAFYAVAIGSIILASLFGCNWQEGSLKIKSTYVYRNSLPFEGYVGLKVALHRANVTLEGFYQGASGAGYVYYAESIPWPDYGHEGQSYGNFLKQGLPDPILKVAGFITQDEGDFRWGRSFHTSGYFAMVLLWTSFAFWIVCNLLLCSVVVYGAYMFTLTGVTMILACVTYHVCQCRLPLVIRFNDGHLGMSYDWSFWLTLVAGCLTFVLGLLLTLLDRMAHEAVSELFHMEKLTDESGSEYDKTYLTNGGAHLAATSSSQHSSIFLDRHRLPRSSRHSLDQTAPALHDPGWSDTYATVNPLYMDDLQERYFRSSRRRNGVMRQLEFVGEEDESCPSDSSLSTLEEDGEKHVDGAPSSTSSGTPDFQDTSNDNQIKRETTNQILPTDCSHRKLSSESSKIQTNNELNSNTTMENKDGKIQNGCERFDSTSLHLGKQCQVFVTSESSCSQDIMEGSGNKKSVSFVLGIDGVENNDACTSGIEYKSGDTVDDSRASYSTDTIISIL